MSSEETRETPVSPAAAPAEKPKVVRRRRTVKSEADAQQPTLLADVAASDSAASDGAASDGAAKPKRAPRRAAAPVETARVEATPVVVAPVVVASVETMRVPTVPVVVAPSHPAPEIERAAPVSVAPPLETPAPPQNGETMRRDFAPRDHPRDNGPRDNGPRDNGFREGEPRDNAPRFDGRFDNRGERFARDGGPQNGDGGAPNPENRAHDGEQQGGDGQNFGGERPFDGDRFDNRPRFRGRNQMRRERALNNRNGRFGGPNGGDSGGYNQQQQQRRREVEILGLQNMEMPELLGVAAEFNIEAPPEDKDALIYAILEAQAYSQNAILKRGTLEILSDGKGFLRCEGYLPADGDVYVSQSQIKRFNLKTGDLVLGTVRTPKEMERFHGLLRVESINGLSPEVMKTRKDFEKLTPIFPTEKFVLETEPTNITARIIDLISPIGKGSRGLIVAPPKAGKTTLIKNIANSIAKNHPDVKLIVLLIDERPEEVTDISRSTTAEVVASTFDEMPDNHMRVADIVMEKAKRLVEMKQDVVILMDSITRLSRASNLVVSPSGRTLSGGLDPAAMYRPKRMFGAARNIEEGGSLTILATALVDTGSRMDEMIFEEFKGTGNLDLVLDRNLFDQRIFPAIDINRSGTRRDDLLLGKEDLATIFHLRRTLAQLDNDKAVTLLIDRLKNTKSNDDFMQVVAKSARNAGGGAG